MKVGVYLICFKNTQKTLCLKDLLSVLIGVLIWEIIIKLWGYILRWAKNSDLMKVDWRNIEK
ncbi:hypothetical protein [Bacillus hominis]|uniref:hypothetical protein n=1 Tax=Bacillus hominis TaxID=2817478 RepID=UPI001BB429E2|nr:hypothetical protein [Bacillus hominis]